MKNSWNDVLLQINGELYFGAGEFSSFDFHFINGSNIDLAAYSNTLKEFWVRFNDGKTFVYKDVPLEIWLDVTSSEMLSIGSFMTQRVKGFFRYERVEWGLHKASLTDVCKNYRTMQYNLNITMGCDATYQGKRVEMLIGTDNFESWFWQLEYVEIPDNCERIK